MLDGDRDRTDRADAFIENDDPGAMFLVHGSAEEGISVSAAGIGWIG